MLLVAGPLLAGQVPLSVTRVYSVEVLVGASHLPALPVLGSSHGLLQKDALNVLLVFDVLPEIVVLQIEPFVLFFPLQLELVQTVQDPLPERVELILMEVDLLLQTEPDLLLALDLMTLVFLLLQGEGLLLDIMGVLVLLCSDQLLNHVLELDQFQAVLRLERDLLLKMLPVLLELFFVVLEQLVLHLLALPLVVLDLVVPVLLEGPHFHPELLVELIALLLLASFKVYFLFLLQDLPEMDQFLVGVLSVFLANLGTSYPGQIPA